MSARKLRPGDFWRICDRTGFRVPASETVKEWNGAIVDRRYYEARHPQDTIRSRPEDLRVPDPRPQRAIENETFVGPLVVVIAADVPGNQNEYAPMGALGQFALGQAEDDRGDQEESNETGSLSITVTSTSRMARDDRIGVLLDTGDLFQTTIEYIASPTVVQMAAPLPAPVSVGNRVFDYTAATSARIE